MLVYNIKLNGNTLLKSLLIIIIAVALIILGISLYQLYTHSRFIVTDAIPSDTIANIEANQYTNILEEVYNNTDQYVGQSIRFTGFVYRLEDMKENEFVLARNMLINSDSQSVVVGFLCNSDQAKNYENGTWVDVSGKIVKGYYHDHIPVIEISSIEKTQKPEDDYVSPPDSAYIPTSLILGVQK